MSCLSEGAESLEFLFPAAFSKWLIAEPDPKVPKSSWGECKGTILFSRTGSRNSLRKTKLRAKPKPQSLDLNVYRTRWKEWVSLVWLHSQAKVLFAAYFGWWTLDSPLSFECM